MVLDSIFLGILHVYWDSLYCLGEAEDKKGQGQEVLALGRLRVWPSILGRSPLHSGTPVPSDFIIVMAVLDFMLMHLNSYPFTCTIYNQIFNVFKSRQALRLSQTMAAHPGVGTEKEEGQRPGCLSNVL